MEQLSKVVIEKTESKLTFEERNSSLEINFFSVTEDQTFVIPEENESIYNSFKKFVETINEGNKNLFDDVLLETVIYSEDESAGMSMLTINVNEEGVVLEFSSPFHTNIILSKDMGKHETQLLCELFEDLRNINASYYQTYLDDYFTSGRELKLELK